MKLFRFFISFGLLFYLVACSAQFTPAQAFGKREMSEEAYESEASKALSFACWNTQTFFDAVQDGTEYSDFQKKDKWTSSMYEKRLDRLCEVMVMLDCDIIVLEEIENNAVVQDIANRLAGENWNPRKNWQYTCFAKETGTAIGCAVFSRYKISQMLVHTLDIKIHPEAQPSERPLMQVTFGIDDKKLVVFVNHWKSKSGGADESEIWRDWQEMLLAEKIQDLQNMVGRLKKSDLYSILACGDFNRSAEEFILYGDKDCKTNTILRGADNKYIKVYSPWMNINGEYDSERGSYFYKDTWERIDNIFAVSNVRIIRFHELNIAPVADEEGKPDSYKMYSETGYSDHLPLQCVLLL